MPQVGQRVRRKATGEVGVVTERGFGENVRVAFPSAELTLHVSEVEPLGQDPTVLLSNQDVGDHAFYGLRLQARYLRHAYRYDPLSGLSNARIEPELHQVYIAHRVTEKIQPRMILADEVGLGKTIEAGLILKELRARGVVHRALVVCPASLQLQWQHELQSKFNEDFKIIDGAAAQHLGRGGDNPFSEVPNVICSLPFASMPKRAEQIIHAEWDFVAFDEAHRVRRWRQGKSNVKTTRAYELASGLKDLVSGLLLLTATPMQLHSFELFSLIELVEPGLYPAFEAYEQRRRELPALNDAMRDLQGWAAASDGERVRILAAHRQLLESLGVKEKEAPQLLDEPPSREEILDALVAKHPLSQVLVRNRKAEVGGFTSRTARRFLVPLTEEEHELYDDVTAYIRHGYNQAQATRNFAIGFLMVTYHKMLTSSSAAIRESLRRRISKLKAQLDVPQRTPKLGSAQLAALRDTDEPSETLGDLEAAMLDHGAVKQEIATLEALVDRLAGVRDSKAAELMRAVGPIFAQDPDERILLFTQFTETQRFLQAALEANGHRIATFNGRMSLDEKEAAVRRFRRGDAKILISTEAGGEGRNFQFCHIVVNYDLPWNPMRVEQRIGRVDRIGQKRPVFIYNLASEGTVEERVLEVLDERIGLFEEAVGSLDPILGEVERDIERLAMSDLQGMSERFTTFEKSLEQKVREARERERVLADLLLDRASLRRDLANELLEHGSHAAAADLRAFVATALPYFGGQLVEEADGSDVISLAPSLAGTLGTRKTVQRGCFDPRRALELEHLDFLAFGHPLLDGIVNLPIGHHPVSTTVRWDPTAPAGQWVEVVYELTTEEVKPSGRLIRHLVGEDMRVHSSAIEALPAIGDPADATMPSWVTEALTASSQHAMEELARERTAVQARTDEAKQQRIARAERVFRYRDAHLRERIARDEEWIEVAVREGSENDRRVLPARRGKVARDRERLAELADELQQEVDAVRGRQADAALEVVAAAFVNGGS